jgi:hypothetical protein
MTSSDEHRAQAAEHERKAEESWQRSDTDGFLTQWAHGLHAQKERLAADIAEHGGTHTFVVLTDEDGNVVPSKGVQTRYGFRLATLDENGRFDEWYSHSDSPRAKLAKHGLRFTHVLHPARADIRGSGRGLSGNAWVAAVPVCGTCGDYLMAIGFHCRNGHTTKAEVTD